jgi:hypothetical protein
MEAEGEVKKDQARRKRSEDRGVSAEVTRFGGIRCMTLSERYSPFVARKTVSKHPNDVIDGMYSVNLYIPICL